MKNTRITFISLLGFALLSMSFIGCTTSTMTGGAHIKDLEARADLVDRIAKGPYKNDKDVSAQVKQSYMDLLKATTDISKSDSSYHYKSGPFSSAGAHSKALQTNSAYHEGRMPLYQQGIITNPNNSKGTISLSAVRNGTEVPIGSMKMKPGKTVINLPEGNYIIRTGNKTKIVTIKNGNLETNVIGEKSGFFIDIPPANAEARKKSLLTMQKEIYDARKK